MLAVNSAVAHLQQEFKKDVEALQAAVKSKEVAIFETLKAYIKESKPIRWTVTATATNGKKKRVAVDWIAKTAFLCNIMLTRNRK